VRNTVCTWLTKPGTTIVLTFVPETRMPWITSGLAKKGDVAIRGNDDAWRHKGELSRDDARCHLAVLLDPGAQIGFGELAGQVEGCGIDAFEV
jgi:hypothetical protein